MFLVFRNWRVVFFFVVLVLFFIQGFFVYTDYRSGIEHSFYSDSALSGLRIWQENNCQACHQIFGFGGFLGPDLTNVADRLDRVGFNRVLTVGQKQMPAFQFSKDHIDALIDFFKELNATGLGFATLPRAEPIERLKAVVSSREIASSSHEHILHAVGNLKCFGCVTCHKPFEQSVGPDLTLAMKHKGREYIERNIRQGRGNMPAFPDLKKSEVDSLLDALEYLAKHRDTLLAQFKEKRATVLFSFSQLPWYEY